ncbi:MAG: DUF4340 domain-containing protein, partial [Treponema sp.]|nr:DUF4340 domain-containing protein [Treponema sp.]
QKVFVLSLLIVVMILVLAGSFVFDPERQAARNSVYVWLDGAFADEADVLEIKGAKGQLILNRKNNVWVIRQDGLDYPVKHGRVEDLFDMLSRRLSYPLRSRSEAALPRLGLVEDRASRITVRGGAGQPLLDLLIGFGDASGSDVYLRRAGSNEARSGEDLFTAFTESEKASWFDLRLFPNLETDSVQRIKVFPLKAEDEPFSLSRSGTGWIMENSSSLVDTRSVTSWLRTIADSEGQDFVAGPGDPDFGVGSIVLEMGNGSSRTLKAGELTEENTRNAKLSDTAYVYSLSEWAVNRIFIDRNSLSAPDAED